MAQREAPFEERCMLPNGVRTGHAVLRLPEWLVGRIGVASPGDGWAQLGEPGVTWARAAAGGRVELLRVDAVLSDGHRAVARATFDTAELPRGVLAATAEEAGVFVATWTSLPADDPLLGYAREVAAVKDAVRVALAPALHETRAYPELWFTGPTGPGDRESGFALHVEYGLNGQRVVDAIRGVAERHGWAEPLRPCEGCGGPERAGGPHRRAGVGPALALIGLDGAPLEAVTTAVALATEPPF